MIEHEFVNTTLRRADRRQFEVEIQDFRPLNDADQTWQQFLVAALRDWGTGLDLHLYESAIAHVFGGEEVVLRDIEIVVGGNSIGKQKARLSASEATFKVTALTGQYHATECVF